MESNDDECSGAGVGIGGAARKSGFMLLPLWLPTLL
jgi:hypothetical protein